MKRIINPLPVKADDRCMERQSSFSAKTMKCRTLVVLQRKILSYYSIEILHCLMEFDTTEL